MAKELVAGCDHASAVDDAGEIRRIRGCFEFCEVWDHFAIHAQASHAAVGKNVQANVSYAAGVSDIEDVVLAALQTHLAEGRGPIDRFGIARARHVERTVRGEIAEKVRRVDVYGTDDAGEAQPNDAPVVAWRAFAA